LNKAAASIKSALDHIAFWRRENSASELETIAADAIETVPDAEPDAAVSNPPSAGILARLAFWRQRRSDTATGPVEADGLADLAEAIEDATTDAAGKAPSPPRAGLLARLAFWRRSEPAEDAFSEIPPIPPGRSMLPPAETADDGEQPAKAPLWQPVLARLKNQWVWLPTAALVLLALGALGMMAFMRGQYGAQAQALQALKNAKQKLEQENESLRTAQAVVPAPVIGKPASLPTPVPDKRDPAFDIVQSQPDGSAAAGLESDDCIVTDKEKVGESLKRCIEAFNGLSVSSAKSGRRP
jgi:hypothetical protein